MTRPPPPPTYETWIDWVVGYDSKGYAAAELAELREERDHWRTAQKTTQAKGELMLAELAELRAEVERLRKPPRRVECLDCGNVFTANWSESTECPKCKRGFTLPTPDPADAYLARAKESQCESL